MLPSAFVVLEQLPMTPNGKLDRRAVPAPELSAYASRQYEPPEGEVEQALAQIWQELLNVERIGRHDNFFELGGHSLLAMKLIAKIEERFGVHMHSVRVFQYPAIAQMTEHLETLRAAEILDIETDGTAIDEGVV